MTLSIAALVLKPVYLLLLNSVLLYFRRQVSSFIYFHNFLGYSYIFSLKEEFYNYLMQIDQSQERKYVYVCVCMLLRQEGRAKSKGFFT